MRADRLLSIVLLLQAHHQLTSRDLAARLEVSERTIHRDMEALSGAGIPVIAAADCWMAAQISQPVDAWKHSHTTTPRPLKPDDRSCVLPFYDEVVRPDARPF